MKNMLRFQTRCLIELARLWMYDDSTQHKVGNIEGKVVRQISSAIAKLMIELGDT